ncbi:GntR family transcriptional regulator, phosphonate transport system regulatory protein [Rhizobiales bacterium GAS191]|nr:GntR family transcriptional regulator, phosphonate transport system regulatory protein [Rhizobiales bacterium GAS113]SEB96169.1 GntR family transcriptional regulator, phosphonate transport system regulatory protein [Rhizobiales bacterium GAS188]SED26790.1 GntR family transcriptional regulator, phosphonate transport system regulatory protein [Rhizobiales bacterium GAS191]
MKMKRQHDHQLAPQSAGGIDPLWRRIEQSLRSAIVEGRHAPGSKLPPDRQIASDYGASRVTARRALAALEQDGLLRIEHGNGTFVSDEALVHYRLGGNRVRFNQNLVVVGEVEKVHRRVLGTREAKAGRDVAHHLGIVPGEPVLELQMAAYADELPISLGVRHCAAKRFRGLAEAFERKGSITRALQEFGVVDYRRASTEITARLPSPEEARLLCQPRVQPVLAYMATDIEVATGDVISYYVGCFASHRVTITIGDMADAG